MRIVFKKLHELKLAHRSLTSFVGVSLVFCGTLGLFAAASFFTTSARLTCSRDATRNLKCQLIRFSDLGKWSQYALSNPVKTSVVKSQPKGYSLCEVVFILSSENSFSMLSHSTRDCSGSEEASRKINFFINSQESDFTLTYSGRDYTSGVYGISFLGLLLGLLLVLWPAGSFKLNKLSGKVYFYYRSGLFLRFSSYKIDEIVECLLIEEDTQSHDYFSLSMRYQACLVHRDGLERIPVFGSLRLTFDEASLAVHSINDYL